MNNSATSGAGFSPGYTLTGVCLAIVWALLPGAAPAQIGFEDATPGSGITHDGESWGASWGDLNADGWPDLFVNNHRGEPALLVNQGNGAFQDRWREVDIWSEFPLLDQHGASWADFNNDGYEDLFISLGSRDDMQLLLNENGVLTDRTQFYGLDAYTSWPGRLPAWLDYNDDGLLDWIMSTRGFAKTFRQVPGGWVDDIFVVGPACQNTQYTQLLDVDDDGRLDAVCDNQTSWPNKVYDTSTIPFTSLASLIPQQGAVNDTAVGDFDNNLRNDLFEVRGLFRLSEVTLDTDTRIEGQLNVDGGLEKSFFFKTTGEISFLIDWNARRFDGIFIGASGYNPTSFGPNDPITIDLDPANTDNWGILPRDPTVEEGIWIGYDEAAGEWEVTVASGGRLMLTYFFVDSTAPITELTTAGFQPGDVPYLPALVMNYAPGFVEQGVSRGLDTPISCISTAAADFDNDMDTDIYVVCRGGVSNYANILYENQGDGTFVALPGAGGAEGPVGIGVGTGESVALADYDVDGFMDIFITNGLNIYPEEPLNENRGGPDRLYRNLGNDNSWIELQLVGTTSNRSAIGAKVYATAGGVTQLREQNGGYHRWSQNHQRIHFGLADNDLVSFTVEWPSGLVENYNDVAANQLYQVTEGSGIAPIVLGEVEPSVCAQPPVSAGSEAELFVWKNCSTGEWHVYTTAGPDSSSFHGRLSAGGAFSALTPLSIETNDVLDNSTPEIIDFELHAYAGSYDEFSFLPPEEVPVCLNVTSPEDYDTLYLGSARVPISNPFDLHTLGPCTYLPVDISVADVSVNETDSTVSLATASALEVTVDYATADATATAGLDYSSDSGTVTFLPGETEQTVDVTILPDGKGEIDETFNLQLSAPVNAIISDALATATIVDDEVSACGEPDFDPSSERGMFIWNDCQGDNIWNIRVTAGGDYGNYQGLITSAQPFAFVAPVDIEGGDVLEDSGTGEISYHLQVWGGAIDGVTFSPANGDDELCFDPEIPIDEKVILGNDRIQLMPPLDLQDLGVCGSDVTCHPAN